jgi:hypothetical protein
MTQTAPRRTAQVPGRVIYTAKHGAEHRPRPGRCRERGLSLLKVKSGSIAVTYNVVRAGREEACK